MVRNSTRLTPHRYVRDSAELANLMRRVAREPLVAVDTEAASFHRFVDRIYLIQLSIRRETAIIDPLTVDDVSSLGAVLADPAVEVVFHDGDYDLRILDRDYGFHARHLFDTRIAAHLLGEPAVGLARKHGEAEAIRTGLESLAFHARVREGYRALGREAAAGAWVVLDGAGSAGEVAERAWAAIEARLALARGGGEKGGPGAR